MAYRCGTTPSVTAATTTPATPSRASRLSRRRRMPETGKSQESLESMYQRTLSIRVLVITIVLAVACGGSALLLHRWQIARTAQSFLAHAQTQEQGKNWLKAA